MAHGDSIQFHPVISSLKGGEKSDEHQGAKGRDESVRPTSLDGTKNREMDELEAQALREAVRASAEAVNLVNAMVGDRKEENLLTKLREGRT
eukprot:6459406-Amphidinium_carterae.1